MFALFFGLWVVLNGKLSLEIVLTGVVLSLLLVLLTCRMTQRKFWRVFSGYPQAFCYVGYVFLLVKEIFVCSWQVIRLILSPKTEIKPKLFYFETNIRHEALRVVLANSITLTPGTITVGLTSAGRFHVHALDASFAEGIEQSGFVRALEKSETPRGEKRAQKEDVRR